MATAHSLSQKVAFTCFPPNQCHRNPPSINKSRGAVLLLANPTGLPAKLDSPSTRGHWHRKAVMTLCSDTRWRTAWPWHSRQCQHRLGATLPLANSKCQSLLWIFKTPKGTAIQKGLLGYVFQTAAQWVSPLNEHCGYTTVFYRTFIAWNAFSPQLTLYIYF